MIRCMAGWSKADKGAARDGATLRRSALRTITRGRTFIVFSLGLQSSSFAHDLLCAHIREGTTIKPALESWKLMIRTSKAVATNEAECGISIDWLVVLDSGFTPGFHGPVAILRQPRKFLVHD